MNSKYSVGDVKFIVCEDFRKNCLVVVFGTIEKVLDAGDKIKYEVAYTNPDDMEFVSDIYNEDEVFDDVEKTAIYLAEQQKLMQDIYNGHFLVELQQECKDFIEKRNQGEIKFLC